MGFEWFIARRYFRSKRKGSGFLSFIKYMSIGGVAIGSAGLLIALSIVHGFKSVINQKILGFAPQITVTSFTNAPIYRADTLNTYLAGFPEIEQVQVVNQGQVMVQTRDEVSGMILKGVSSDGDLSEIRNYIAQGRFDLSSEGRSFPGIVLGSRIAEELKAEIGNTITVYTVDGVPSLLNSPELEQFELTGIYKTGIDQFDEVYGIVDRKHTLKLFELNEQQGHLLEIKLLDFSLINSFDGDLNAALSFPYYTQTVYERYANIFAWVDLQEQTIPFVISVMVIVAAFNLIGAVLMMVLERTKDVGILKTIGAGNASIRRIFLFEGLFVAVVGLLIGTGLSMLFYYLQSEFQIIPLNEQNYYMSSAPVEPQPMDFLIVAVVTLILCSLAAWIPARIAAKLNPLRVISYGKT
jgi:lipoprotein-releasing system permease protein